MSTKLKVGDHVRIVSKSAGEYTYDDILRDYECPDINNSVITKISIQDRHKIYHIKPFNFRQIDLMPCIPLGMFYDRLLTKVTKI